MTVAEVAALFRVDPETVRRWVKMGKLRAVMLPSGRVRVRREDVEAFMTWEPS